jgi:hypothetical protein
MFLLNCALSSSGRLGSFELLLVLLWVLVLLAEGPAVRATWVLGYRRILIQDCIDRVCNLYSGVSFLYCLSFYLYLIFAVNVGFIEHWVAWMESEVN